MNTFRKPRGKTTKLKRYFMERVGTGIKRIKECCGKNKNKVEFKLAEKDFFVILNSEPLNEPLNKSEKRQTSILIINYIQSHNNVKRDGLVNNLKIPLGTLKKDLTKLMKEKIIKKVGSDKTGYYILIEVQKDVQ